MTDATLAARFAPVLMCDTAEPYPPQFLGWSVHRAAGPSPSSRHRLDPAGGMLIEYAIWYDWDIQHLYDLEHVWVLLRDDAVAGVTASCHGQRVLMDLSGGLPALRGGRPVLYVEPGKHAHWADGQAMRQRGQARLARSCGAEAGSEGVHRGNGFHERGAYAVTPQADRLARRKLMRDAFVPSFRFASTDPPPRLMPWPQLETWIPTRIGALIDALHSDPDAQEGVA